MLLGTAAAVVHKINKLNVKGESVMCAHYFPHVCKSYLQTIIFPLWGGGGRRQKATSNIFPYLPCKKKITPKKESSAASDPRRYHPLPWGNPIQSQEVFPSLQPIMMPIMFPSTCDAFRFLFKYTPPPHIAYSRSLSSKHRRRRLSHAVEAEVTGQDEA